MKSIRVTAAVLAWMARIVAVVFTTVSVYALMVIALSLAAGGSGSLPISVSNGMFEIYIPFTKSVFLLGHYTSAYLVPMLLAIWFYSLFFWLLSGVFNAFTQQKLFVPKGVRQLTRFYRSNFCLPVLLLSVALFYNMGAGDMLMITVLHAVLGVFAWFMAAIFKQGLLLQEEQDLTL